MRRAAQIAALVCGGLAIILGIAATQATWAEAEEVDGTTAYHAFSAGYEGPAQPTMRLSWSDPTLDGQAGISMLRTGGTLLAAGVAFTLLAVVATEHALWFEPKGAQPAALIVAGIGAVLAIVGTVALAIGMNDHFDAALAAGVMRPTTDFAWTGGFVVGILAAVFALGTFVANLLASLAAPKDPHA